MEFAGSFLIISGSTYFDLTSLPSALTLTSHTHTRTEVKSLVAKLASVESEEYATDALKELVFIGREGMLECVF